MSNRSEELARITKLLMFREPYYGLFLMTLQKRWMKGGTASVSIKGINFSLNLGEEFWDSLNEKTRQGLLKHELLHICFFHLTDFGNLSDRHIANIAMDIEINQYIDKEYLPEGGCTLESFAFLNLEPNKGTRYYYDKLMEYKEAEEKNIKAILQAIQNKESSVTLPSTGETVDLPDHDWEGTEKMDEGTAKVVKTHMAGIIKEVASQVLKSRGTVPSEITTILEALENVEPEKYDWRSHIRRFAGKSEKTYTKKSRRKLNKRLPDFPGLKIKKRSHILVGIDTSGSVSNEELREFLQELYHIQKTGSQVTIAQCDAAISSLGPIDLSKDIEITGRGGTSFQPVIDYYNENRHKYSCLIYCTDGECSPPENCVARETLWVLSEGSQMNDKLPGQIIQLN